MWLLCHSYAPKSHVFFHYDHKLQIAYLSQIYKSGLVALVSLLCLVEVLESNFVHRYGNETGVALHLLNCPDKLNLRLNQGGREILQSSSQVQPFPLISSGPPSRNSVIWVSHYIVTVSTCTVAVKKSSRTVFVVRS